MTNRVATPLSRHRALMAHRGLVRLEVSVSKNDADLIRQVAAALSDPARQAATRMLIQQRIGEPPDLNLKTLLAAAPLDGIDLDRAPDLGQDIDL